MSLPDPFQPFWRPEVLTGGERALLEELLAAHHQLAFRRNLSTDTAIGAAQGSGDFGKAFSAALLTSGGKHAPLAEAMTLLSRSCADMSKFVTKREPVPGWGNSLVKNEADHVWQPLEELLSLHAPDIGLRIVYVTRRLHGMGKRIFPNAAAYTAAVALVLGIPPATAPFLFLWGRMVAWAELIHQNL